MLAEALQGGVFSNILTQSLLYAITFRGVWFSHLPIHDSGKAVLLILLMFLRIAQAFGGI